MSQQKRIIYIFLYAWMIESIQGQTNPVCKGRRYICSQVINIDSTMCAQVIDAKNKQIELWNCPVGYSCDFTNMITDRFAYCKKDADAAKTLPGESCSQAIDCLSKQCTGGLCVGAAINQSCTSHNDCDVGYYCQFTTSLSSSTKTGLCQQQVTFGKACSTDYDCQNNCVCSLGYCTYYYSLDVKIAADNNKACASGYATNGLCSQGLSSKDPNRPKPCSSYKDCVLVDDTGEVAGYTQCQCGYNPGSFSYCQLSEGDQEYQDVLTAFLFVLNTNFHCHTSLRYGPCKYIYDDEYIDYNKALNLYQMAPQVTYNDYCIKRAFNWQYWTWLHSSIASVYSSLIIMIVYYMFI